MDAKFTDGDAVQHAIDFREEFIRRAPKDFPLKEHIEYVKYLKDMKRKYAK